MHDQVYWQNDTRARKREGHEDALQESIINEMI